MTITTSGQPAFLQSMLNGVGYSWTGNDHAAATVHYAFDKTKTAFPTQTIDVTPTEQAAAVAAMSEWSKYANVTFDNQYVHSSNGLVFAASSALTNNGDLGFNYVAEQSGSDLNEDNVLIAPNKSGYNYGGDGYITFLHEIGHSLGLSHPGNSAFNEEYSVMSTTTTARVDSTTDRPTAGVLDIAAAQFLYGVNNSYNATDTTYGFTGANKQAYTIWDGGGKDTINISGSQGTNNLVDLRGGVDSDGNPHFSTIDHSLVSIAIDPTDFASGKGIAIENVIGSALADTIIGGTVANSLTGGAGNDLIVSSPYNHDDGKVDTLDGGIGNDTIWSGVGDSVLSSGGNDSIYSNASIAQNLAGDGLDTIIGWSGVTQTNATNATDVFVATTDGEIDITKTSSGIDTSDKLKIADFLISGTYYTGNLQPDSSALGPYYVATASNPDSNQPYYGGFGAVWHPNVNSLSITYSVPDVNNSLVTHTLYQINNFQNGDYGINFVVNYGAENNPVPLHTLPLPSFLHDLGLDGSSGGSTGPSITGTSAAETLTGTSYAELMKGLGGADTMDGQGGNDTMDGGADQDAMTGGAGSDTFKFASTADSNYYNSGPVDRITDFTEGSDKIDLTGLGFSSVVTSTAATPDAATLRIYTSGGKTLISNSQTHFQFTMDGDHTATLHADSFIFGASGPATLTGSDTANDTLTATSVPTLMQGLGGNDTLNGGAGADTLVGGAGADVLTGNGGNDTFKFASTAESNYYNAGPVDRITDFTEGADKIDLRGLGFTSVITSTVATPDAATLRIYYTAGTDRTYVANSQTHFQIALDHDHTATLHQDSFLLA